MVPGGPNPIKHCCDAPFNFYNRCQQAQSIIIFQIIVCFKLTPVKHCCDALFIFYNRRQQAQSIMTF